MSGMLVVALGAVVLVPLAREYVDFRRRWGVGRAAALATTALLLPSFLLGIALALPLAARPDAQWAATVLVTLLVYSLAVRAVEAAFAPARGTG
jgi:hypothetical protein